MKKLLTAFVTMPTLTPVLLPVSFVLAMMALTDGRINPIIIGVLYALATLVWVVQEILQARMEKRTNSKNLIISID